MNILLFLLQTYKYIIPQIKAASILFHQRKTQGFYSGDPYFLHYISSHRFRRSNSVGHNQKKQRLSTYLSLHYQQSNDRSTDQLMSRSALQLNIACLQSLIAKLYLPFFSSGADSICSQVISNPPDCG